MQRAFYFKVVYQHINRLLIILVTEMEYSKDSVQR